VDKRLPADDETSSIFAGVLGLIDSTLTGHYRVPRGDAVQLEQELLSWFQRFSRRPGSPRSPQALRPQLLLMACQAGHVYWSGKLEGEPPEDERLNRSLTLGPHEIAIELERVLEEREGDKKS
jgi:hypothetical protein